MFTINCRGRLVVADKPLVMGIINITPDSFYQASRFEKRDEVLRQAERMLEEGADILDVGGQSTRPGSEPVSVDDELKRVLDPIDKIHRAFPEAIISIDTFNARVAQESVAAGAGIVNDVSAGTGDPAMLDVVASLQTAFVLMHMKGEPKTMQQKPTYENVTREVLDFLIARKHACNQAGITDVIVDPGFGFGKTIAHNFELLSNLTVFSILDAPLLVGLSRKSTVYKTLGVTVDEALNGTTVLNTIALMNGAAILRVHDVKEARQAVNLWSMTQVNEAAIFRD